jgi:hypothetical protein
MVASLSTSQNCTPQKKKKKPFTVRRDKTQKEKKGRKMGV